MKPWLILAALAAGVSMPAMGQGSGRDNNFSPGHWGGKKSISVTTTSSSVALDAAAASETDLMIYNAGTAEAYCHWDVGSQTALTTDVMIPSGTVQVFSKGSSTGVACITATGTAMIEIYSGYGR